MKPFTNRKPNKERLSGALLHQQQDEIPYWESTICRRNLEFIFERKGMPDLSWGLPFEDQIKIAQLTGQDAIAGGGFWAPPRIRKADGSLYYFKEGELQTWEQLEQLVPYTDDEIRTSLPRIEQAFDAVKGTDIGIYVGCGGAIWQAAWQVVGFDDFMMKTVIEPDFVKRLIDFMAEPAVRAGRMFAEYPLTFLLVGDNISTTKGPFNNPDSFIPMWCPLYVHALAFAPSYMHRVPFSISMVTIAVLSPAYSPHGGFQLSV